MHTHGAKRADFPGVFSVFGPIGREQLPNDFGKTRSFSGHDWQNMREYRAFSR